MDTGIVRKMDDLGRIVIPAETRRLFHIREGDELTISVEMESIKLQKLEATCTFCGSTEEVRSFHGKGICANCTAELNHN
jgi:transcriptional pleiotropic regulator of transition state genes